MVQIKKQYTNPVPILYLYRKYPEISLVSKDINSATDITLNQQINEVTTLSFKMPYTKDRKISPNDCEKLVKFEGEYYIIKEIKLDDDNTRTLSATCYHESVELKGVYCSYLDLIGVSPEDMFNAIMKATKTPNTMGYKWAGTDVPSDKFRHLQTDSEESVYANLVAMAEVFGGWLEFYTDESEQKWVFLRTKAIKKNKFIKKGIDMKSMGITYDSSEIFTQLEVFGSRDSLTGEELNIMGVNPTGKSYLEDYSYYLAKGIPQSVIDREPKYQQLKVLRDDTYTDANDLMTYGQEELKKCSVPQLEATISLSDLSIYVDNPTIPPMVGYELICIDSDIEFNIDCMITGVNRNYTNPADTQVTISNVVKYNTLLQDINHTVEDMDGVLDGDSNGVFIPECVVKDNNGISITVKLGDIQSNVEIKYNEIMLRVDDFEREVYAEIKLTADSITQTVADNKKELQSQITQTSTEIRQEVTDTKNNLQSQITVNANGIASAVSKIDETESKLTQTASEIRGEVADTKEELNSTISQTASSLTTSITDTRNDLQTKIEQTASAIRQEVTDKEYGLQSQINHYAGEINSKVSSTEYNTYVTQTDKAISSKVSKGSEFSSEMKQNVDAFQFLFEEVSGSKTEISKDGLTIYKGGIKIKDKNGNTVFYIESDGTVHIENCGIENLSIQDTSKSSMFFHTLANMKRISCGEISPSRLTLDYRDFYIGDGYNLKQFVERVIDGRDV